MANQIMPAFGFGLLQSQTSSPSTTTLALNATGTWLGYSWVPPASKTVSKLLAYCSAVNGTLGATDLTADIFSNSSGAPGSSLASSSTVTVTPTGAAWVEWTGFSLSVSKDTQYWIVLKNANGTPATNYPTYQFGSAGNGIMVANATTANWSYSKKHSTNSGSSWATGLSNTAGWRIEFNDGTFIGFPLQSIAAGTDKVYGTRELGIRFTSPSNGVVRANGLGTYVGLTGAAGSRGNLRFRLYAGTTLLGTTYEIPNTTVGTGYLWHFFASPIVIPAATAMRIVMGMASSGDASNYYNHTLEHTIENSAGSKACMPLSAQKTYYDGSSWTDTDTAVLPFGIIPDVEGEFGWAGEVAAHSPLLMIPTGCIAY